MNRSEAKADDRFPRLEDVIPARANKPGLAWAYIKGEDIHIFQKEGWVLTAGAASFELDNSSYVVMHRGTPDYGTVDYLPQVFVQGIAR